MTVANKTIPGPGQESVWNYPRPPSLERFGGEIEVQYCGETIASTENALRVLETSHPPVYYLPPEDVNLQYLRRTDRKSWCEWKGHAEYFDVAVADVVAPMAAWAYDDPVEHYAALKGHIAFYPGLMEACRVNGELVTPQPGGFYGGWVTSNIVGPFKGEPGTRFW